MIDRDLRWRDPDSYQLVFRRVASPPSDHLLTAAGDERLQGIFDVKFVFRNLPSVLSPVDWQAWGSHVPVPARPEDHARSLIWCAVTRARSRRPSPHTGSAGNRAASWCCGIRGLGARLPRPARSHVGLRSGSAGRPGRAGGCGTTSNARAASGPGSASRLTRFVIDADAYQGPSPTLNAAPVVTLQLYLSVPDLAWDFLALAEPDRWNDYFAMGDMGRVEGADFIVGGQALRAVRARLPLPAARSVDGSVERACVGAEPQRASAAVGRSAGAVPARLRQRRTAGSQRPGAARPPGPQPAAADPAAGRCRSRRPPGCRSRWRGCSAPP